MAEAKAADKGVDEELGMMALKELARLRKADVSQSSGWPRVTVFVQKGGKDERPQVDVTVNGRPYNLFRGVPLSVPPEVVDALGDASQGILQEMVNPDGSVRHETVNVPRFPHHITDAASQERYELWNQSGRVNAYMHANPPFDDGTKESAQKIAVWKAECAKTKERDMVEAIRILDRVQKIIAREEQERARLRETATA